VQQQADGITTDVHLMPQQGNTDKKIRSSLWLRGIARVPVQPTSSAQLLDRQTRNCMFVRQNRTNRKLDRRLLPAVCADMLCPMAALDAALGL
jgi:hypothetical protein